MIFNARRPRCQIVGLAVGLLSLLTGCGHQAAAPSSPSGTAASEAGKPFTVAYNQWIGLVGVFLAKDKGYFQKAGLNVDLKQFSGPADGVPPLMTGALDGAFTTADTPILLGKNAGNNPLQDVWIVDTSNGADGIVAEAGIPDVKALKGKAVAATKGQVNEFLLLTALKASGMGESDVKVTNMDADAAGAAMVAHKVPAAVTWEPWLTKAQSGGAHVIFTSRQAPNTILDVFTVSQKTLTDRPNDVRAFVAACAQGADYANAHPDEAAQTAAKYFGSSPQEAKDMLTKVKVYGVPDNHKLMGTAAAPGPAVQTVGKIAQFFVAQKVLPSAPDTSKTFNVDYLPQ